MRPITSGLGSAPHRLAKVLAKSVSRLLGTVSDSHLKNSGDLLNCLNQLDFRGKKMASFDVTALFTNVPVKGAMQAIEVAIRGIPADQFPVPKQDFMKLVELCLNFQAFSYDGEESAQVNGLAMGSPLSPVAACLYMEMLEKEHFKDIMGAETSWLRYVDDVFILVPEDTDLNEKLQQLNAVEKSIQFTLENENHGTLPFLDVMIIRCENAVKFKVYRKGTNREDYIHYFSAHSDRIKSGIVIGFFLRAQRICSDEYLKPEIEHIFDSFMKLRYPKAFIIRCLQKAKKIKQSPRQNRDRHDKILVAPSSSKSHVIARALGRAGVKFIEKTGSRIGDLLKIKGHTENKNSVVYKIPCGGCTKAYLGETGRGLKKRIMEHRRDVRNHQPTSSFVIHIEEHQHLPKWDQAEILWSGNGKRRRKMIESIVIETLPNINSKRGDYTLAPLLARVLWKT